jgi:hypothetical protein
VLAVSCIISHFTPHALHLLILVHIYAYAIDHVQQELDEPSELAQAEDINPDPKQGKLWCI